ncbi:pyroglutamyl peptidase [Streptomonospora nanhaiensis]|uniref:Pyrrolidone-carboxylate peptidase n=1 Tax=Streptomonospora nanhaiensis TaxID=1323731 RepID=A0A853BG48_9ACTN|nr:pyroglutamyl peptidase [Streptomonospora nanhaiensis]MBV2366319.1 pyroglutamyl peptidase [Streptomonospora nanhaiensis]NYI94448.1 pyrrolidone-carboxylate peptidase [Streptomonospora nanhaiensis]
MKATASTVEESRTASAAPQAILRRSGFAAAAPLFAADLAAARSLDDAVQIVASHGRRLWTEAVRQAGEVADDRHLYWARLTLSARLRAWRPDFPLEDSDRAALSDRLERASRGHDDLVFPPDDRLLRVIVTGFDPSGLDTDLRRSNPSGAAALTLHGAGFEARGRTAAVRTALFPARWRDLSAGMVERVLGPHYAPGPGAAPADAVITVGQGDSGRFDLAVYYAGWRDGTADNEGVRAPGPVPLPRAEPGAAEPPAWTESSLPRGAVPARAAGRFPVREATEVTEIAPGETAPRTRAGGPVGGSAARAGSAGAGFSNEVAYRNTLLRDASGRDVTAGHVLTPALEVDAADPEALSGPAFERDRADIVAQLRAIIEAALER